VLIGNVAGTLSITGMWKDHFVELYVQQQTGLKISNSVYCA